MNHLKFRVYHKKYGFLIDEKNHGYLSYVLGMDGKVLAKTPSVTYNIDQDDYIIQTSTGYYDRSGNEVFEGDIVEIDKEDYIPKQKSEVIYDFCSFGCVVKDDGGYPIFTTLNSFESISVVGNTPENLCITNPKN